MRCRIAALRSQRILFARYSCALQSSQIEASKTPVGPFRTLSAPRHGRYYGRSIEAEGGVQVSKAGDSCGSGRELLLRVLGFPFRGGALAASLVFAVLLLIAAKASLFGVWLAVVLAYGYLSYCFHLLESVAIGRQEPPVLSIDMMNPAGDWRPLALAATTVVYAGVREAAAYILPEGVTLVLGLAMILILPGVAVVLALESNLGRSLNPLVLIGAGWGLGLFYLAAGVVAALVALGVNILRAAQFPALLWIFLSLVGISLVSSILGGGLYWRRLELNVQTVASPEQTRQGAELERKKALARFLDEVYLQVRGHERDRAYALLREYLVRPESGVQDFQEIFQAVCAWNDPLLQQRLGQDYLTHLLGSGETGKALDVLGQCLSRSGEFRPREGAETLRLAQLARIAGQPGMARTVLSDFGRVYPGHPGSALAHKLMD